jgi:hypothetical protein
MKATIDETGERTIEGFRLGQGFVAPRIVPKTKRVGLRKEGTNASGELISSGSFAALRMTAEKLSS